MRLLVTGAGGMLGRELCELAPDAVGYARADLDITDAAAVDDAVADCRPDAIVNCAAWTDVDGAEVHEADATAVNGDGAGNVAVAAARVGALCVQVSSDYVFDGRAREPYTEDAATAPIGAYGRSKLAGERAALAVGGDVLIARSSWIFGRHGRNFVATMLRLGAERDELAVVDDQVGCPTWTGHLAPALIEAAERRLTGVVHVAGSGRCSWADFAREIFQASGIHCDVRGQSTAQAGRPAPRPAFSAMRSTRPDAPVLPPWQDGLAGYLSQIGTEVVR